MREREREREREMDKRRGERVGGGERWIWREREVELRT
jgi:hypothetical protein